MAQAERDVSASESAGRWKGGGSAGQQLVAARHRTGHRGYVWRDVPGQKREVAWCDHAHRSYIEAIKCGQREARRLNKVRAGDSRD